MGGVDLIDSIIGRNHICLKSRKWTPSGHNCDKCLDSVLYKDVGAMKEKSQKDIMKLADFRTELADTLYWHKSRSESKRGRPNNNS